MTKQKRHRGRASGAARWQRCQADAARKASAANDDPSRRVSGRQSPQPQASTTDARSTPVPLYFGIQHAGVWDGVDRKIVTAFFAAGGDVVDHGPKDGQSIGGDLAALNVAIETYAGEHFRITGRQPDGKLPAAAVLDDPAIRDEVVQTILDSVIDGGMTRAVLAHVEPRRDPSKLGLRYAPSETGRQGDSGSASADPGAEAAASLLSPRIAVVDVFVGMGAGGMEGTDDIARSAETGSQCRPGGAVRPVRANDAACRGPASEGGMAGGHNDARPILCGPPALTDEQTILRCSCVRPDIDTAMLSLTLPVVGAIGPVKAMVGRCPICEGLIGLPATSFDIALRFGTADTKRALQAVP